MPTRTWLPLTPRTVTVTSLPIITVSPTRLVKISILLSPSAQRRFELKRREQSPLHYVFPPWRQIRKDPDSKPSGENVPYRKSFPESCTPFAKLRTHYCRYLRQRRIKRCGIIATGLRKIRAPTATTSNYRGKSCNHFTCWNAGGLISRHADDEQHFIR